MKATLRGVLAASILATAALAPAYAQEVVGTLRVDANPVMVSTDGTNFTAVTGSTQLHVGDRINIADQGSATLTYNNGYVLHYESPGVYTVQLAPAGTATTGGMSTAGTVGVVLGAAALAGAAIDSEGNVKPIDPISP